MAWFGACFFPITLHVNIWHGSMFWGMYLCSVDQAREGQPASFGGGGQPTCAFFDHEACINPAQQKVPVTS
jgi:hypothetical protein